MENPRITFFDTTLRDGEQSPGCSMGVYDKLRMARQLDELGVDVLEAGFPIASEDDYRAVRLIGAEVSRPVDCRAGPRKRAGHPPRMGSAGDGAPAAHPCFPGQL